MDPLTQGVLGAAVSSSFSKKSEIRIAALAGALSGMAADLDVLIRSKQNPLLFIEYHRNFSHSLPFVPIGAFLCAIVFWLFLKKKMSFGRIYFYSFLGYLTHGLLDACTSYGTMLWWPFSQARIAWNNVAIVDPLYTIPLLLFVLASVFRRKPSFARLGFALSCLYLLFGVYQHQRAENFVRQVAQSRGHSIERLEVMPTVLNLLLWRSIYESNGRYYVDAVRTAPSVSDKLYEGSSVEKYNWEKVAKDLPDNSTLAKDLRLFAWFANGYLYAAPNNAALISDLRYSMMPQEIVPMWGIVVDPAQADQHADFKTFRHLQKRNFSSFLEMIEGKDLH